MTDTNDVQTLSIVILISGRGSNALAILDAIEQNRLCASLQMRAVIADSRIDQPAAGLARMAERGIDTALVDPSAYSDRTGFEQALAEVINSFEPDLIVLAGFMRVLSAAFVEQFEQRIVNIHPSLLPNYRGLHTHQRALDADDKKHGASVHWVTAELDAGPVIAQAEVPIEPGDTADTLAARVLIQEHRLYPSSLALLAQTTVLRQYDTTPKHLLLDRDFDDAGRLLADTDCN
ncbi:MAG: phosphoribosylglycinamide formyltransferase [Pseudomonadota bacterium]